LAENVSLHRTPELAFDKTALPCSRCTKTPPEFDYKRGLKACHLGSSSKKELLIILVQKIGFSRYPGSTQSQFLISVGVTISNY
jgi:methylphosphotriester-DNA--protein-cysteine methyltransferase